MLSKILRQCLPLCAVLLGACSSTKPLDAGIEYKLPVTEAGATISLSMTACENPDPDHRVQKNEVDAEVSVSAKPAAGGDIYRVDGELLASYRVKRSVTINVSEDGVINGINTTNTDQTPAIIGSVLKAVLAKAGGGLAPAAPEPTCAELFPLVSEQLKNKKAVDGTIGTLRQELRDYFIRVNQGKPPEKGSKPLAKIAKEIEAALNEQTRLQAFLKVETTAKLDLGTKPSTVPKDKDHPDDQIPAVKTMEIDSEPFVKWAGTKSLSAEQKAFVTKKFAVAWSAVFAGEPLAAVDEVKPEAGRKPLDCGLTLVVPKVRRAKIALHEVAGSLLTFPDNPTETIPVPQWGPTGLLCLDVAFGESRSIAMKYDKFGRVNEFTWSSEATGVAVTEALAGTTESAMKLSAALKGKPGPTELEKQKAEVDALETLQKLNALKACEEILRAGGYTCEPK